MSWLLSADLITAETRADAKDLQPRALDIDAEIARYGAETRGGIGVSVMAAG